MAATAWQAAPFEQRLTWARRHMVHTHAAATRLPALDGVRLAYSAHLDLKTAVTAAAFLERGAVVRLIPADPASTHDDVVDWLCTNGAEVDLAPEEDAAEACVRWEPTHALEAGAAIMRAAAHKGYRALHAGVEITRTGLTRLAALELHHPVFDIDVVPVKNDLHNRYAVGVSTWQTFMNRTNLSLRGRTVVVAGHGQVGIGLAQHARDLGAHVIVVDPDPMRRLLAQATGYQVAPMAEAARAAHVLVTATGREHAVDAAVIDALPDGCFLLNAGHSRTEIDTHHLGPGQRVLPTITEHSTPRGHVLLVADGHLVNLAAGDGDSLDQFDWTAALTVAAIAWATTHAADTPPGITPLPDPAWHPLFT
ncbi:NAD(P)-dependent oxidoreductase [Streptomyces sp. NPDC054829]